MIRYLFFFTLSLAACSGKEITIEDFDQEVWRNDVLACDNRRISEAHALLNNKDKLLGLNSDEVMQFLGKPDRTELYTRNQKFFHYYISPAKECENSLKTEDPALLTLRFNATGLVKEITLYD